MNEMTKIERVTVAIESRFIHPKDHTAMGHSEYILHLELPVPGGNLKYEINIQKDVYESIEFADQIIRRKMK